MKKMILRSARCAAAALLGLALAGRPAGAAFLDLGAGARAPGLGDAFTALADDAYAVHYNPAGLAQLQRPEISAAYAALFLGLSDNTNLGISQFVYAQPIENGRQGTLGLDYERFSASNFYYEQAIGLSYGRLLWQDRYGGRLMAGLNLKYLTVGFGGSLEATNALGPSGSTTGFVDPVLTSKNSKSAVGADLGLLYRFPQRWQLGLAVMNVNEPNVGFASADKAPMSVRAGAAWKGPWMALTGEVRQEPATNGGTARQLVLGAERIFPTLTAGQFGVRGSLGYGAQDFEQLTLGLGYRINKIQLDYAFLMPFGTVQGTAGTHRISLGWYFGGPAPEEELTQELLDQARQLREARGSGYGYEYSVELHPQDLDDPILQDVRALCDSRRYRAAHDAIAAVIKAQPVPVPAALLRLANRIELVASYYPEWAEPRKEWEIMAVSAIDQFLRGHDHKAIVRGSYAFNLGLNDAKFDHFLAEEESALGLKADRLPLGYPRTYLGELLARVAAANSRKDFQAVQLLLKDIIDIAPRNAVAMERAGSMYYVLGHNQEALEAWTRALAVERNPEEVANIKHYLELTRQKLGSGQGIVVPAPIGPLRGLPGGQDFLVPEGAGAAPATQPAPATQASPVVQPAPAAPSRRAAAHGDPRDVDRLFQKGVEHYARGEYLQATAMFMRILQIDPYNVQARKALDRIQADTKRSAPQGDTAP